MTKIIHTNTLVISIIATAVIAGGFGYYAGGKATPKTDATRTGQFSGRGQGGARGGNRNAPQTACDVDRLTRQFDLNHLRRGW